MLRVEIIRVQYIHISFEALMILVNIIQEWADIL